MIKAAKKAICAVLDNADVNNEDLKTAFVGLEAQLNSLPLAYQSAYLKDATPLTPDYFLHGQMGGISALESSDQTTLSPTNEWRQVPGLVSDVLKIWMSEWLPLFEPRVISGPT